MSSPKKTMVRLENAGMKFLLTEASSEFFLALFALSNIFPENFGIDYGFRETVQKNHLQLLLGLHAFQNSRNKIIPEDLGHDLSEYSRKPFLRRTLLLRIAISKLFVEYSFVTVSPRARTMERRIFVYPRRLTWNNPTG